MAQVRIGTSGWTYPHWRGNFYPTSLAQRGWLGYYAKRLNSVEINASFYRLPASGTLRDWVSAVPDDFVFAMKASRYLTHMRKLREAGEGLDRLMSAAETLGGRLGPILFQLPPHWHANPERLAAFVGALPRRHRYAFELRDSTWWCEEVFTVLRERGAALVWFDLERTRSPEVDCADFRYVRWHGPAEAAYRGRYGRNRLRPLARRADAWKKAGQDVYVYFDNDEAGYAAADALALREMLGG